MSKQSTVVGWMEQVNFPDLGLQGLEAKIDTGAYSGALHCTNIKVVRRGPERRRVLKFTPDGHAKLAQETDQFIQTHVRSALGHKKRRYLINTNIELQGRTYPIRIGLSDRSEMKRPVLIGRRFLRENNITVDVRINAEHDDEGENLT